MPWTSGPNGVPSTPATAAPASGKLTWSSTTSASMREKPAFYEKRPDHIDAHREGVALEGSRKGGFGSGGRELVAVDTKRLERVPTSPHRYSSHPAGAQHPSHLPDGGRPRREELQTLLAQHDIEGAAVERQRVGRRVQVLDRRGAVRRPDNRPARQHRPAHVAGHHESPAAGAPSRCARHHTCPTGDVEHPAPRSDPDDVEQHFTPRFEHRRDEIPLISSGTESELKAEDRS